MLFNLIIKGPLRPVRFIKRLCLAITRNKISIKIIRLHRILRQVILINSVTVIKSSSIMV